ncbi:hypothetical protein BDY17DRAFT_314128 [Neohortaea acidophila]|uniref:Uncharacterized protein n=1 Tax=Neohortaea acidophila TaxID=245834 RepID=A0A6A6PH15_9PEZI|nr:uncharacterized protein BDY17DRAFT_314128 [Neohortaea acidophila]KAF2478903.1 hypothetical protein BDY17DRAFT_314128 [Neohortaea acidophila]
MFLEPDARKKSNGSAFFHAQTPIVSPRDYLPFIERTPSEVNQQNQKVQQVQQVQQVEEVPESTPPKPTVRLVRSSPAPSYDDEKENIPFGKDRSQAGERVPLSTTGILTPASLRPESQKPALAAQRVSGVHAPPKPARDNLLSSLYTTNPPSRAEWHRRSGSSGNYSNISTLHGESVTGPKSVRTQSTASQGTTLRGTPTPSERESSDRSAYDTNSGQWSLQPLHETSPRPSTVRIISTPPHSIYSDNWEHSVSSEPSANAQLWSSPTEPESVASFAQRLSRRTASTGSLPSPRQSLHHSSPPRRRSQGSIDRPDSEVLSSSPNFVSYNDSSPSRPQRYRLYKATSIDSISSRLQTPKIVRIESGRSVATTVTLSSSPSPSEGSPPPELDIPKNQLRHKPASSALHAAAASSAVPDEEAMADEDVDTLPYPRQPFIGHLSTIASESDARSQVTSQQFSHFSIGSGVTTGDEASIIASTASPRRLPMSFVQQLSDSSSSGSGAAWPQPLFHARTPSAPQHPLPPIPPIPGSPDSQEGFDTVPELTAPRQLREQRSGYSLRHRSHSTPSRSRSLSQTSEASRHSQVANVFPTWAKAYYTYGAPLLSSSQISLALPIDPQRMQNIHQVLYSSRDWSDRSTISRLGSVSEISSFEAVSPISNRFLPNIWRPRNRKRSVTGIIRHIKTISTSQPSQPSMSQPSISPPESMMRVLYLPSRSQDMAILTTHRNRSGIVRFPSDIPSKSTGTKCNSRDR